jgi:hypothetical protein
MMIIAREKYGKRRRNRRRRRRRRRRIPLGVDWKKDRRNL